MASTPVQFEAPSGLTLTLSLYPYGSDTLANTGTDSATEKTNMKGLYEATVDEALSGLHNAKITDGSGNLIATYHVVLEDDTNVHRCGDFASGGHVDAILTDTETTIPGLFPNNFATLTIASNRVNSNMVAINGSSVTTVGDIYWAKVDFSKDDATGQDEYTVVWFKGGDRQTSGITSPTIQVIKRADGTDLVASTSMTEIGSTGSYKYDEGTNRITAGEAVLVVVGATIDGSARSYAVPLSRDSSA